MNNPYQMINISDTPLVSIIVITYNSAEFVLETLESAKVQTYPNIELLISDDGSTDNTADICKTWLTENAVRFVNTRLILVEQNTGISSNCDRGVAASKGEWVKLIAGDDILLPNCIKDFVDLSHEQAFDWAVSAMMRLDNGEISNFTSNTTLIKQFFALDSEGRYKYFIIDPFFLNPPSGFYRKSVLSKDTIDVSFRLLEDQPLFSNLLKLKKHGVFMHKQTVIYRRNSSGVTGTVNKDFVQNLYNSFLKYRKVPLARTLLGRIYCRSVMSYYKWFIKHYSTESFSSKIQNFIWIRINIIIVDRLKAQIYKK